MKNFKLALTSLILFWTLTGISAQGWINIYQSGQNYNFGTHELPNGYCYVDASGYSRLDKDGNTVNSKQIFSAPQALPVFFDDGFVIQSVNYDTNYIETYSTIKYDYDGNQLWQQIPAIPQFCIGTQDQHLLSVYRTDSLNFKGINAIKYNPDGSLKWEKQLTTPNSVLSYFPSKSVELPDGNFMVLGHISNPQAAPIIFIIKFDADGNVIWERKNYTGIFQNLYQFTVVKVTLQGDLLVSGYGSDNYSLLKIDTNGNLVWEKENGFSSTLGSYSITDMLVLPSGNIMAVAKLDFGISGNNSILQILSPEGEIVWEKLLDYTHEGFFGETISNIRYLSDGNLLLGGIATSLPSLPPFGINNTLLVKTDTFGNVYSHFIEGNVFNDQALDCEHNGDEGSIPGLVMKASDADNTYYALADEDGQFQFNIPEGQYELSVNASQYWESCQASYLLEVSSQNDTVGVTIPVQPTIFCPLLEVDIVTPLVRNCSTGVYVVKYCNHGTTLAENATVQVSLAPELTYLNATGILVNQDGQLLTFDLGNVQPFDCGSFTINYLVECGNAEVGQSVCTEAHAFPDTLCFNDPYTGPVIEADANCQGDSVQFIIKNTGSGMGHPFEYIVIEDNIILRNSQFQLAENEEVMFMETAQNGSTYHLLANQDPTLPAILGNPFATASVEGCLGIANPGAINQFPLDDGEPWLDIDCNQVVSSFDPNDKTGFPTGWQDEHFIDERTNLDYLIRFQNTGTDTAFNIVIIDTLSSFLNPITIRPGAGSHSYRMELSGHGIVRFIFEDIMLPDSNVNEALSHGFVQFHIAQQPDNQPGTRIENTADIYFDFNAPVRTDTAFHTIREPWVQVVNGSVETFLEQLDVKISPNPMGDWAMIEVAKLAPGENTLTLFDSNGIQVLHQQLNQNKMLLQRYGLVAGLYYFRIENKGRTMGSGKIIVR